MSDKAEPPSSRGPEVKKDPPQQPALPNEAAKPESPLAARLREIRNRVKQIEQNIITSVMVEDARSQITSPLGAATTKHVTSEHKALTEDASMNPDDYVRRSGTVIKSIDALTSERHLRKGFITQERAVLDHQLEELDQAIVELELPTGLLPVRKAKELMGARQLRELKLERQKLVNRQFQLKATQQDLDVEIQTLQQQDGDMRARRKDMLIQQIHSDITAIKREYASFIGEAMHDETLTQELQDHILTTIIEPKLRERMETPGNRITPEEKMEFIALLKQAYGTNEIYIFHDKIEEFKATADEKESARVKLAEMTNKSFYGFRDDVDLFVSATANGGILRTLFEHVAAEDLNNMYLSIAGHKFPDAWDPVVARTVDAAIRAEFKTNEDSPKFQRIEPKTMTYGRNLPIIDRLPTVQTLLGVEVADLHKRFYEFYLDRSLIDIQGSTIDALCYYPTPDTIRNLVLIAAADYKGERTAHANSALNTLSRRTDWPQILDAAEAQYPALKDAHTLLEKWHKPESAYVNNPDLTEAAQDFIVSAYTTVNENPKVNQLAKEALSNNYILITLQEQGVITPGERDALLNAVKKEYENQNYNFRSKLRETSFTLLDKDVHENLRGPAIETMRRIALMASDIKNFGEVADESGQITYDNKIISYIFGTTGQIFNPLFSTEMAMLYLRAYRHCPLLLDNINYLDYFRQFSTPERLGILNEVAQYPEVLVAPLGPLFSHFLSHGATLIHDASDVALFVTLVKNHGIINDPNTDKALGRKALEAKRNNVGFTYQFNSEVLRNFLKTPEDVVLTTETWKSVLINYIAIDEEYITHYQSQEVRDAVRQLFTDNKSKDFCLHALRAQWQSYLKEGDAEAMPFSMIFLNDFINGAGGAGPLRNIESLSRFSRAFQEKLATGRIDDGVKKDVLARLSNLEERFDRERWTHEDRSNFYVVSTDIIAADAALYSEFLGLFENLQPKELARFAKELYPLFQGQLVLMQLPHEVEGTMYNAQDVAQISQGLRTFADKIGPFQQRLADKANPLSGEERTQLMAQINDVFSSERNRIFVDMQTRFKDRFGMLKVPEEFTPDSMRSLNNMVSYLANIASRTPQSETILSFYLSLMLNGKWEAFRRGETIDPAEFLEPSRSATISELLRLRAEQSPLKPEALGIEAGDMEQFQKILQTETEQVMYGQVRTIDEKLGIVVRGVAQLEDPDLYPDPVDKSMRDLFVSLRVEKIGGKKINTVLAKTYQQLSGKALALAPEEQEIQDRIKNILGSNGREFATDEIKKLQDSIKPMSLVSSMVEFVVDQNVDARIEQLRQTLQPSTEVITLFKKMGENFTPQSGALALTQDLSYLENLIVKHPELSPEETGLLKNHLQDIRQQMVDLEEVYDKIKNQFKSLRTGISPDSPSLLTPQVNELERIIANENSMESVSTRVTSDMNVIIENIRACLSCSASGFNNDTNLTFGDSNKFFMTSQTPSQRGSIADEIVFFEPVQYDGKHQFAFVMDQLYGVKSSDIMMNHIATLLKKNVAIKSNIPNANVAIVIPGAAMSSVGVSGDIIKNRLQALFGDSLSVEEHSSIEVDIVPSAMGDHYIELGGGARRSGKRSTYGLVLNIAA